MPPKKGERLYVDNCAACHGVDGEGFKKLMPPINDPEYLDAHTDEFACMVYYGMDTTITVKGVTYYDQPMKGFTELSTVEITNLTNYVYKRWSTGKRVFKEEDIKKQLENCR